MHLVVKQKEPERLKVLQEQETPKWVDRAKLPIEERGPEPPGLWLENCVRQPIREDFLDCCCFCGVGLGEAEPRKPRTPVQGEVEHFLPKSKRPELVYDWHNLLWACKDCNGLKGTTYGEKNKRLLHPCVEEDMAYLRYHIGPGTYELAKNHKNDPIGQYRLKLTQKRTYLNRGCHPNRRKTIVNDLRDCLRNLVKNQKRLPQVAKEVQIYLEENITRDVARIRNQLVSPDYRFLIRAIYEQFRKEEAEATTILNRYKLFLEPIKK